MGQFFYICRERCGLVHSKLYAETRVHQTADDHVSARGPNIRYFWRHCHHPHRSASFFQCYGTYDFAHCGGCIFYLRPRVALAFFTEVLVLFTISVLLVGLPRNVLVSNLTNGIVAIAIGMTLSVISWRGFAVQYVQTKKILEQQRELEQMAYRDPLTGLPNRRFLDEVIKKEIALIKRGTRNSCVVMIDIDDFKEVNDTYGHPVGDEVLKQLAQLLLENIRESDTLARLGGEEFVILLSDANCDGAYIVANKLREQIKNHVFKVDGYVVQITASFGVGPLLTSDQGPNYYSLVDKALYKAKSSGKNQIAAARDLFQ